ncbi:hypothetical protein [Aeromonas phage AerS_266]|nr:hypothetical protein [Aeromonas phage AerS_266]
MINEITIAEAIKHCISKVSKDLEPVLYLYEVNQILNRFKTNLYKMMDETKSDIDPANLLNITIKTGAIIRNGGGVPVISEVSPVLLKIYGERGYGKMEVPAKAFDHTLDISTVFDAKKFCQIKDDYYRPIGISGKREKEISVFERHPDVLQSRHCVHISSIYGVGFSYNITGIISGIIYPEVLEKGRSKIPNQFDSGVPKGNRTEEMRKIMSDAAKRRYEKLRAEKEA